MNTSIEGATPNGIARAVRDGSAGLPPPKSGCPEEDAILCASAIFTMQSIEQVNCAIDALKLNIIANLLHENLN